MKVLFSTFGLIAALALGVLVNSGPGNAKDDNEKGKGNDNNSRIQIGLSIAPVPLNLGHQNRAQVGLGSYLVNAVGGCNDCHTNPPYTKDPSIALGAPKQINNACYLNGGVPFGPFVSRNITPENGLPAGLTF